MRVRQQIGVLSAITSRFLIPDNHIGRATVSSIAVAHEVALMGGRAVACLNARDRNVLGFRRDLLTAAAYGVDEFLFVYGDRPETGRRSDDLTVRTMLEQARTFDERFRLGVSTRLTALPTWKREADFLFVQVSFSLDHLLAWRRDTDFDGPVYAGVLVVPSPGTARKLTAQVPQLAVPADGRRGARVRSDRRREDRVRPGADDSRQRRLRWRPPHPHQPCSRDGASARGTTAPSVTQLRAARRCNTRRSRTRRSGVVGHVTRTGHTPTVCPIGSRSGRSCTIVSAAPADARTRRSPRVSAGTQRSILRRTGHAVPDT